LEGTFGGRIKIKQKRDPGVTGNFKVTADGQVLHDKKVAGGKCETQDEVDALVEKLSKLIQNE